MDMSRPPAVDPVAERVSAGFDGTEEIVAVVVSQHSAAAAEVGIDRSDMSIVAMAVASARIRLPDLHEGIADRTPVAVQNITMDDDLFVDRLASFGVVENEIVVERTEFLWHEHRAGHFR